MSSIHPSENTIASLQTILDATKTGNYELFLTVGDADYKTGISQEMFDSVSSQLAPRMAEGYNIAYFGNLKQGKYQIYLWKLSFADDGDEFIARMAMNGDKVGGILIT
jgi:exonuclease VII large subunit